MVYIFSRVLVPVSKRYTNKVVKLDFLKVVWACVSTVTDQLGGRGAVCVPLCPFVAVLA